MVHHNQLSKLCIHDALFLLISFLPHAACAMEQSDQEDDKSSFGVFLKEEKNLYALNYRDSSEYFAMQRGQNKKNSPLEVCDPKCNFVTYATAQHNPTEYVFVSSIKKYDAFESCDEWRTYINTFKAKVSLAEQSGRLVFDMRPEEWKEMQKTLSPFGLQYIGSQFEVPTWRPPKKSHPVIGTIVLIVGILFLWRYLKK